MSDSVSFPRIFVFDNVRVRSHVFVRMLSEHKHLMQALHPFLECMMFGPERLPVRLRHSEERRLEVEKAWLPFYKPDTYGIRQKAFAEFVKGVEAIGKGTWANDHCCVVVRQDIIMAHLNGHEYSAQDLGSNPTYLPDWYFQTCSPIIMIRHPALTMLSFYKAVVKACKIRPGDEDFEMFASMKPSRWLFDVFKSQGREPIVIDGEDIIWRTDEVVNNLCKRLGIDKSGVSEKWDPYPQELRPQDPVGKVFVEAVMDSKGLERPDEKPAEPIDVEQQLKKISDQFSSSEAASLKPYIVNNIADYEYLASFKI